MAATAAATNTSALVPQFQALFQQAQIPQGVNPFSAYLMILWKASYPGIIPWSKPLFIIIAVTAGLNLIFTIVTMVAKFRREGLPLWKMRDHRSGSRYISLNSINVFLVFNLLTCIVWILYPSLHLTYYNIPGHAYMDLGWATMMWLAPYTGLLLTSIGICYGILVAPTPIAYTSRTGPNGQLQPISPPLAFLPCWLLNAFVVSAPLGLIVAVAIPSSRLINATKTLELFGLVLGGMLQQAAVDYATTGITVASQVALLEALQNASNLNDIAASRWRPVYGTWAAFCGMAVILAMIAFFALRSVTRTRVMLARNQYTESFDDSGVFDIDMARSNKPNEDSRAYQALKQAKFEHRMLGFQFGSATVLLFVCFVMLLCDCIKGWSVHTDPNMLAAALLVIMIAYFLQSTPSVALVLYRTMKAQDMAGVTVNATSPKRSNMSREDSDWTLADTKKMLFPLKAGNEGAIYVSSDTKGLSPVSPSGVHQIQIQQVVHVETDGSSLHEKDDKDYEHSDSDGSTTPVDEGSRATVPVLRFSGIHETPFGTAL